MNASPVAIPSEPVPAMFAANGIEIIDGTNAHAVACYWFQAVTDCVISSIAASNVPGGGLAGKTIPAGHGLPVKFTSITLSSGWGWGARTEEPTP